MNQVADQQSIVFAIDDDASVRDALTNLLRSVGLQVKAFATTAEFLRSDPPNCPSCLILDVRLPGLSGLDFQSELAKNSKSIPIVFLTGHGDIPMSVRAMKAGAVEFLTKPFRDQDMLDAVQVALERDRTRREGDKVTSQLRASYMNKQIAHEVGLSEITIKVHRGNVMHKMGAKSLADLVRMAEALGVRRPGS
jgi:FixJ family two-component response regulator